MEFIEVQPTQEESYLSAEDMFGDEVVYISESEIREKHPDTNSMTEKLFLNLTFQNKNISSILSCDV